VGKGGVGLVVIRRSSGKLQKVAVITEVSMFRQNEKEIQQKVIETFTKEFSNQIKQLRRGVATWL